MDRFQDPAELGGQRRGGRREVVQERASRLEPAGDLRLVADDPLTCVARGGGRALEMIDMGHGGDFFSPE